MDKQIVFKTSAVGGFEKKAVLDYIYKLNESIEETQARLEEKIKDEAEARAAAEQSLIQLRGEMSSLREKYDSAMEEIGGSRHLSDELGETVERLSAEIEKQDELLTQKEAEIRDYVRQFNQLSSRSEELEKKRTEIDNASAQIGKLIIDAHTEAENIAKAARDSAEAAIAEARRKADDIIAQANTQARIKAEEAEAAYSRKMDDTQKAVDTALERLSLFRTEISNIQRVVLSSIETMHEKAADISEVIDSAQEAIHNAGQMPICTPPVPSFEASEGDPAASSSSEPEMKKEEASFERGLNAEKEVAVWKTPSYTDANDKGDAAAIKAQQTGGEEDEFADLRAYMREHEDSYRGLTAESNSYIPEDTQADVEPTSSGDGAPSAEMSKEDEEMYAGLKSYMEQNAGAYQGANPMADTAGKEAPGEENGEDMFAELRAFLDKSGEAEDDKSGQEKDSPADESKQRFLNMLRGWIN